MNQNGGEFYITTDEDEQNYFTGEVRQTAVVMLGTYVQVPPGNYRIIDGELCRIDALQDIRDKLGAAVNE